MSAIWDSIKIRLLKDIERGIKGMVGEKFTLMQYQVSAILGLIEAEQFVIPEIQKDSLR